MSIVCTLSIADKYSWLPVKPCPCLKLSVSFIACVDADVCCSHIYKALTWHIESLVLLLKFLSLFSSADSFSHFIHFLSFSHAPIDGTLLFISDIEALLFDLVGVRACTQFFGHLDFY